MADKTSVAGVSAVTDMGHDYGTPVLLANVISGLAAAPNVAENRCQ